MPNVQIIEATKPLFATNVWNPSRRKRVCAYARVSTGLEEQQLSFQRQIIYFTEHIQENPEWEFVGIYSDRGISATSIKHREGFKSMIADAKAGKIDLILCKSISRFARNVTDAISAINELKECGVEVQFERENISSFEERSAAFFSILSVIAQEESHILSDNIRWGYEKKARAGKAYMNCAQFLGYKNDEKGNPVIVEEEAEVVREIYKMYIEGKTPAYIAKYLTRNHVPTPARKEVWSTAVVRNILTNEKYMGDFITSKTYTVSFLDKKLRKNTGQKTQAHIKNHHPAIIEKEVFDYVQIKISERANVNKRDVNMSPLSGKLRCAHCGKKLTHRVWHSRGGKNRYDVWVCGNKYNYETCGDCRQCQLANFKQKIIEAGFVCAIERLLAGKTQYLAKCDRRKADIRNELAGPTVKNAIVDLTKQNESHYAELAKLSMRISNPEEDSYSLGAKMQELLDEIESNRDEIDRLKLYEQQLGGSAHSIARVQDVLRDVKNLDTFDAELFRTIIEDVTVDDDRLVYRFVGDVTATVYVAGLEEKAFAKTSQVKVLGDRAESRGVLQDYVDTCMDEEGLSGKTETRLA